jgi:hypothetical protein
MPAWHFFVPPDAALNLAHPTPLDSGAHATHTSQPLLPMPRSSLRSSLALLVLATGLSACAPRLAPLYHDYQVTTADTPAADRVKAALEEAGWQVRASDTPNVIATEERTLTHWGLYKIEASLEVATLGDEHVRVFIHPYRHYVTGGRSKIPFLRRRLRGLVLPDLTEALSKRGLHRAGTPFEKDRVALTQ